jgi:hypothetical protein
MARQNYSGEKRRKELDRKNKKAEKKRRKLEQSSGATATEPSTEDAGTTAAAESAT